MDRHFILISEKHNGYFCGKCGKRILMDNYNAAKHAAFCGFDKEDEKVPVKENDYGYRLEAETDRLLLSVCRPELVLRPGFPDRFSGMQWIPCLCVAFPKDAKEPVVLQNNTGMNLTKWLQVIRQGRCYRIQRETDAEMIGKVFPNVLGVYSLQMFAHIYRHKGIRRTRALPPEMESYLFRQAVLNARQTPVGGGAPDNPISAAKPAAGKRQTMAAGVFPEDPASAAKTAAGERRASAGNAQGVKKPEENGKRIQKQRSPKETVLLQVSLYRLKGVTKQGALKAPESRASAAKTGLREEIFILRITAEDAVFLFSRGYAACSRQVDLVKVLSDKYSLDEKSLEKIRTFDRAYPEYMLAKYAEKSHNILVPLLAGDFHCGIELAAKAAAPAIAENFDRLSISQEDPSAYQNLKQMFGLPVYVLQALKQSQADEEILKHLRAAFRHNPVFVQFPDYTSSMISFYRTAVFDRDGCRLFRDRLFNKREVLRILRYLHTHPNDWQFYYDYLYACEQSEEYIYGLTPSIPIRQAHDSAVERVTIRRDKEKNRRFSIAVSMSAYQRLVTENGSEEDAVFKEDHYIITAPSRVRDMIQESTDMHNCVRIYVDNVCGRTSKIYFLRKKEDPGKSFGTIEVRGKKLIQAKAFANRKLPKTAREFVRKWCTVKGLEIATRDLS